MRLFQWFSNTVLVLSLMSLLLPSFLHFQGNQWTSKIAMDEELIWDCWIFWKNNKNRFLLDNIPLLDCEHCKPIKHVLILEFHPHWGYRNVCYLATFATNPIQSGKEKFYITQQFVGHSRNLNYIQNVLFYLLLSESSELVRIQLGRQN